MKIKGTFLSIQETKAINHFLTLFFKDADNLLNQEENEEKTAKIEALKVWAANISQIVNQ
jgi:hypothetical protein